MPKGPKPKNGPSKSFETNQNKAKKLPSSKKKKTPPRDTAAAAEPENGSSDGTRPEHPQTSNNKSKRSVLGFVFSTLSCIGLWGWSIYEGVNKQQQDRRILDSMLRKPFHFTQHGQCRMDCRFISRPQVVDTLRKGTINARKSEPLLRPCAKYVVDAEVETSRGGEVKAVQGVFAACRSETKVITVIDKETNWPCGPC